MKLKGIYVEKKKLGVYIFMPLMTSLYKRLHEDTDEKLSYKDKMRIAMYVFEINNVGMLDNQ
jgi:hypothetical protein